MKHLIIMLPTFLLSLFGCNSKNDASYKSTILEETNIGGNKILYVQVSADTYTDSSVSAIVKDYLTKNKGEVHFYSNKESFVLDKQREETLQLSNFNNDILALQKEEDKWYMANMPTLCKGAIAVVYAFRPNEIILWPYTNLNGSKYCDNN